MRKRGLFRGFDEEKKVLLVFFENEEHDLFVVFDEENCLVLSFS